METPIYVNGATSTSGKSVSLKRVINHKKDLQKEISDLEKLQKTLLQQRKDLEYINENIKGWAESFDTIERNTQGVPFVRNVKEICASIENLLNDIHGDFYFRMQNLITADVPCFQQVYEALELLKKQVSKIIRDDAAYKASFIEEIRQILGRLTGITDTMLEIYFEQWIWKKITTRMFDVYWGKKNQFNLEASIAVSSDFIFVCKCFGLRICFENSFMQEVLVHVLSRYKTIERQVNTKKLLPIYSNKRKKSSNARKGMCYTSSLDVVHLEWIKISDSETVFWVNGVSVAFCSFIFVFTADEWRTHLLLTRIIE